MSSYAPRSQGRPGGPVGAVFVCAAVICSLWAVPTIVNVAASRPLPPGDSGLVSQDAAALVLGAVTAGWALLGWWTIARATSLAVARLLVVLLLSGPVGVVLSIVDSLTMDLINADHVGPVLMIACLIVAPFVTIVGAIASLVELWALKKRRAARPFGI